MSEHNSEPGDFGIIAASIGGFPENMVRLSRLTEIHAELMQSGKGKDYADEILRAMVVLMHASLEDALRGFVRHRMRGCPAEKLDTIPLCGTSPTNRPQKFSLVELGKYRGKTVDELIEESIEEYLNRTSFNSSRDIAGTLEKLGIDLYSLLQYFPTLDEMISRRHQIVHQADREDDSGNGGIAPIDKLDVVRWMATVVRFIWQLYREEEYALLRSMGEFSEDDMLLKSDFEKTLKNLDELIEVFRRVALSAEEQRLQEAT
jgi:hypothetical protein